MGVYELDATQSPKRGLNVYHAAHYMQGSGGYLHKSTNGEWWISNKASMVSGEHRLGGAHDVDQGDVWIVSTTVSPSPLGLQWKAYDGTAFVLDPLITVTEST